MKVSLRVRAIAILVAVVAIATLVAGVVHRRQQNRLVESDPELVLATPQLRTLALIAGRSAFRKTCAACHGAEGRGNKELGVPDLTDDDVLYGTNSVAEVEQIVLHGIRAGDSKGWDLAWMPAFAQAVPYPREKLNPLTPGEINDLVAFLRGANGFPGDRTAMERGRTLYAGRGGCWDCHGSDAAGDSAIGAPNLVDGIWLKGDGSVTDIRNTLTRGLRGVSPAYAGKLSAFEIRAVAAYVASLHPAVRTE